jgi:hypothetical protein
MISMKWCVIDNSIFDWYVFDEGVFVKPKKVLSAFEYIGEGFNFDPKTRLEGLHQSTLLFYLVAMVRIDTIWTTWTPFRRADRWMDGWMRERYSWSIVWLTTECGFWTSQTLHKLTYSHSLSISAYQTSSQQKEAWTCFRRSRSCR